MVRGSKKSEEAVAEAKNAEAKAKKPVARVSGLMQKAQGALAKPLSGSPAPAGTQLRKKVEVSQKAKSFGRNINTAKAEPRLAKKRKQLLDIEKKSERRPRESKKMKHRRLILAAVMEARVGLLKRERKRPQDTTPGVFKLRSRKGTPIVFSLEEVQALLKARAAAESGVAAEAPLISVPISKKKDAVGPKGEKSPPVQPVEKKLESRVLKAASVLDILGFNPKARKDSRPAFDEMDRVPKKWLPYYKSLVELRDHFRAELSIHTEDSLKKSVVEDLGDNQDLNDGSSESSNRDLVLSLVSSEQEALYEINEAIDRILKDTYGVCEVTQRPISKERLAAVPFTRYSIEGQADYERSKRRDSTRSSGGSVFSMVEDDDAPVGIARDDIDDE